MFLEGVIYFGWAPSLDVWILSSIYSLSIYSILTLGNLSFTVSLKEHEYLEFLAYPPDFRKEKFKTSSVHSKNQTVPKLAKLTFWRS